MGEPRIHEDTSTIVSLGGSPAQGIPGSATSTAAHVPAEEAEIQTRRDEERLLALQLLDLEWTSLSPELQQAVLVVLHGVTKGR